MLRSSFRFAVADDPFDGVDYLVGGNQPRAFKSPVRITVPRAIPEIAQVKILEFVPASVADIFVKNAIRILELVYRKRKAGNHDDRNAAAPCQPAQSA